MNETTRSTYALTVALLLGPALGHAADSAPSPIAQSGTATTSTAALAKSILPQALTPAKADDYKDPDLWARIRSGYAIPDIDNALVAKHVQWYASRPDYVTRTSSRANAVVAAAVELSPASRLMLKPRDWKAPTSTPWAWSRLMPRWSVVLARVGSPRPSAGLPGSRAMVCVGPP